MSDVKRYEFNWPAEVESARAALAASTGQEVET